MRMFQYDAPLWRGVSTAGDLITLNLISGLCAVPLVTAGASFTALADTARRIAQGDETASWRLFARSFRANFRTASLAWAVVGPFALLVLASWIFLPIRELVIIKTLVSIVVLLGLPFLFSLIARFDNTVSAHLKNAWLLALGNLPLALGTLAMHAALLALIAATATYLPQGLPILLLLGASLPWVASVPLIERAFAPMLRDND